MKKFILITTLFLLTRILDGISTYIVTPDLAAEANPLHSVFQLGWIGLFVANLTIISLCVYASYLYYTKPQPTLDFEADLDYKNFISVYFFKEKGKFYKIFYTIPTISRAWIALGHIMTLSFTFYGAVILINNTSAYYYINNIQGLWYDLHVALWKYHLTYGLIIPTVLGTIFVFFQYEFKKY
jgi:hypothetical protein